MFIVIMLFSVLFVAGVAAVAWIGSRDGDRDTDARAQVDLGWESGPDEARLYARVEVDNPGPAAVIVGVAAHPISMATRYFGEAISSRAPRRPPEPGADGEHLVVVPAQSRRSERVPLHLAETTAAVAVRVTAFQRQGRVRVIEFRHDVPACPDDRGDLLAAS